MATKKVAVTVDQELLRVVDRWVVQGRFKNRSQAFQAALTEQVERWVRRRLDEEVLKLDPQHERALAEESLAGETWPTS